ncbi:hypothetical protein OEZ86_012872 [Tetradesmus obliquus]|nr:hypothetical protein OEZ86_012872 [Tetradesmus obliquus]
MQEEQLLQLDSTVTLKQLTLNTRQVTDQASGKPYYWNTATNETAWALPAGAALAGSTAAAATAAATAAAGATTTQQQPEQQQQQSSISFEVLLLELQEALDADGSGMMFWEAARARRKDGVFEPPFTDFLEQRQQPGSGCTPEQRDQAFKMMARLSNPLLRQPAPFEF